MSRTLSTLHTNPLESFPQAIERAQSIKVLALDVDGVLTDGSLFISADGKELLKVFDSLDGHGIKLLASSGVQIAIITGRQSPMVEARARELGIQHVFMGVKNKLAILKALLEQLKVPMSACAAIGDDWPDLAVLTRAGMAISPSQGHDEVKKIAHYVCSRRGGQGAVREVCDLILHAQGHYTRLLSEAKSE